jgi:hypothetical protein
MSRLARAGAAFTLLAGAGLGGCETTGAGFTSPYLNTTDGYFYKYGNFCGPGWPAYPAGNSSAQQIALIDSMEPVDDIDRVCRAHDRCYWQYGQNNEQCDLMLAELLRDHTKGGYLVSTGTSFLSNEFSGQCANLAGEILTAVGQFKRGDFIAGMVGDDQAAQDARTEAAVLLGFNAVRNLASGWPEVPGLCFFNDDQRATAADPATQALLAAASAVASSFGAPSSLASFEPFFPASDASLAAGRSALDKRRAELAAAAASGGGATDTAPAEP